MDAHRKSQALESNRRPLPLLSPRPHQSKGRKNKATAVHGHHVQHSHNHWVKPVFIHNVCTHKAPLHNSLLLHMHLLRQPWCPLHAGLPSAHQVQLQPMLSCSCLHPLALASMVVQGLDMKAAALSSEGELLSWVPFCLATWYFPSPRKLSGAQELSSGQNLTGLSLEARHTFDHWAVAHLCLLSTSPRNSKVAAL